MEMRVPSIRTTRANNLQNRAATIDIILPQSRCAKPLEAGVKVVELFGEWLLGVAERKRKEADRLIPNRVEDFKRQAPTSNSRARDAESVVTGGAGKKVFVGGFWGSIDIGGGSAIRERLDTTEGLPCTAESFPNTTTITSPAGVPKDRRQGWPVTYGEPMGGVVERYIGVGARAAGHSLGLCFWGVKGSRKEPGIGGLGILIRH